MKKAILVFVLLLTAIGLRAQSYTIEMDQAIPSAAAQVLQQRLVQMLEAGGLQAADEGTPLLVSSAVTSRMETPGSISQVALTIELKLSVDEAADTFDLKGVGADDSDAWLRAVKQFLPRSKAAQNFVGKLK